MYGHLPMGLLSKLGVRLPSTTVSEGAAPDEDGEAGEAWRDFSGDAIALARLGVVGFNLLAYLFISTGPNPIPWLAYATLAVAAAYSSWILTQRPHDEYPALRSCVALSATDATLITAWLTATGGFQSPYFVLWYVSVAGLSFRYGPWETLGGATIYTFTYAGMTAATGSLIADLPLLVVRSGYIYMAASLGLLVSMVAYQQTVERHRYEELSNQLKEANQELADKSRKLEATNEELRAKTRELESANEDLRAFTYAVSHDVREPLRTIATHLDLAERRLGDDVDETVPESIGFARNGAHRLDEMIDGLLAYSRVERKGDPMQRVDLEDVVDDALANLGATLEDAGAQIEVDRAALPAVHADASQLTLLVQNLLSNAVKFQEEHPARVEVRAEADGDACRLEVADDGVGIPEEVQEHVFQIFHQGAHDRDGQGLGLALCKRIVDRHGGSIALQSTPGEGSTFTVTLPLAGAVDEAEGRAEAPAAGE